MLKRGRVVWRGRAGHIEVLDAVWRSRRALLKHAMLENLLATRRRLIDRGALFQAKPEAKRAAVEVCGTAEVLLMAWRRAEVVNRLATALLTDDWVALRARLLSSACLLIEQLFQNSDATSLDGSRDGIAIAFRVREACLADLATTPVEVVALIADPIARLVLDGTSVAGVEDRRVHYTGGVTRPELTRLGQRLIVGPENDERAERVGGNVLNAAALTEGAPGRREDVLLHGGGKRRVRAALHRLGRMALGHGRPLRRVGGIGLVARSRDVLE
jgi:hypothetical protein